MRSPRACLAAWNTAGPRARSPTLPGATAELANSLPLSTVMLFALRQTASLRSHLLLRMHDFQSGHGSIGLQPYTFSRELVHRRQNVERTAIGLFVHHNVRAPTHIRSHS